MVACLRVSVLAVSVLADTEINHGAVLHCNNTDSDNGAPVGCRRYLWGIADGQHIPVTSTYQEPDLGQLFYSMSPALQTARWKRVDVNVTTSCWYTGAASSFVVPVIGATLVQFQVSAQSSHHRDTR
jgi:hypothetical protein